ncbi:DUF4350 domain-containing protein [Scleromatobacter humisilvae]|uniref:DUF4350 domain-containing protein n=1 Tax=Scleromatobacter humisilvae TaxID=2897159 RepID=A0A9X2C3I6_9BURK|nr:DUF4350 domain-containing protein [Scleromatobacter humisilvae]MCK9688279.1 DUF4350 domain-containing protein [Scleromatobacter humisilvae]
MKGAALIRTLVGLLVLALLGWVVWHTRWEEIEVDDPARGAAASDEVYSLRHVLEGAGATLETRTALEPMPPAGATLLLESTVWDIFPERDARLKAWVENGGHLVVTRWKFDGDVLRWVPLSFARPQRHPAAKAQDDAASDAEDTNETDDDEDAPATRRKPRPNAQQKKLARLFDPKTPWDRCADFEETDATPEPAFEPGRVYHGCTWAGPLRTLNHVAPTWQLTGAKGTLAMRVAIGRGDVTGLTAPLVTHNMGLLHGDNALIAAAVLQAAPGRVVWIVGDEAREPLLGWMWHEARTPSLLALAAIALALWRLMLRFGPREALPPQARRSMGEQVRGTGHFIAGSDPRALHAATRQAFDAAARRRVEGWAELDDDARIEALAATLQPAQAIDRAALRAAMHIGGGAAPAQILAATAVLEQARRALLRAPAAPLV